MNGKQFAIGKLEDHLKLQEQHLEHFEGNMKNLHNEIAITEADIVKMKLHIEGLKDAIHKLKGLDNLEKKNIEEKRPASMTKNLLRTETAQLYGKSIASYSRRELAAYVIHQSDRIKELLEHTHF